MTPTATALLALHGVLPSPARLRGLRTSHGLVVAADGAAKALLAAGLDVDLVIGDLDSIGDERALLEEAGVTVVEEPSQETGDFEKALLWLAENGEKHITIVGFDGGMLDHSANNLSVLARHAPNLTLDIISGNAFARCVVDSYEFVCPPAGRVSLIPLPEARLTTAGLVWELRDETLAIGIREGCSNRARASDVSVSVAEGVVLVVHYPDGHE